VGVADVTNSKVYAFGDAVGLFGGLTPGARYYLSGTVAGALTATAPSSNIVLVGIAKTATEMFVDIDNSVLGQAPGEICYFARNTAPDGFLKANGAAISRTAYDALFAALVKSSVVTISIAAPGVITWLNHGRSANDPVKFSTSGALPTGFVAGSTYYVVGASITSNTFQLSATAGGAAINTSGAQSGQHTAINAPWGDGDGSTTFNIPDLRGEFARGWDDSRGIDTNRAFGTLQNDDFKSHSHDQVSTSAPTGGAYLTAYNATGSGPLIDSGPTPTKSTGGTETRPRNIALLACIKY
jgi:microcystin-dependent protein